MKYIRPRSTSAATPTPAPIPAFAPVVSSDDPELGVALGTGDDVEVGMDVEELGIADEPVVAESVPEEVVVVLARSEFANLTRIE